jgi:hypothetical protein
MSDQPLYSRIKVKDVKDGARLYPLIIDYIKHPEHAETVTEFVFLGPNDIYLYYFRNDGESVPDFQQAERTRGISDEQSITEVVDQLGLGDSKDPEAPNKEEWVRTISWLNPALAEERTKVPTTGVHPDFARFIHHNDVKSTWFSVALLLMLCPNIERLVLVEESSELERLLRRNNYGLLREKRLQKLKHVELLPHGGMYGRSEPYFVGMDLMRLVQCFHQLPCLESISVSMAELNEARGSDIKFLYPQTSSLKKLSVEHALFRESAVTWLIRMAKRLEELTWSCGGRATNGGHSLAIHGQKIGKALLVHRETLRKLDLDLDGCWLCLDEGREADEEEIRWHNGMRRKGERDENGRVKPLPDDKIIYDVYGSRKDECYASEKTLEKGLPIFTWQLPTTRVYEVTIGSLHDFTALTHLSIGIRLLLGDGPELFQEDTKNPDGPHRMVDAIPPNLEYLLIRGYEKGENTMWDNQIEEFTAKRAEMFPALKEIHGLDEPIPSAEATLDPRDEDDLYDIYWSRPEQDEDWKEVTKRRKITSEKRSSSSSEALTERPKSLGEDSSEAALDVPEVR